MQIISHDEQRRFQGRNTLQVRQLSIAERVGHSPKAPNQPEKLPMTESIDHLPDQLFPADALHSHSSGATWRVAHTKSRREKKLAQFLVAHNIAYYLPLLKKRQPGQRRARFSYVPAFGNYVFVKVTDQERHFALRSNLIARMIEVQDQSRLVRELINLQTALVMEEKVYPYDYVSQGQWVRVIQGPMQGLVGVVERKKSGFRLVVNVTGIFQAVAVDLEADMVEPIDGAVPLHQR